MTGRLPPSLNTPGGGRRLVVPITSGSAVTSSFRSRIKSLLTATAIIAVGLVWRLVPLGLPGWLLKYGGSVLWGGMVYFLVATVRWPRSTRPQIVLVAFAVAAIIEFSRLYHTPASDAFRLTLPGALLLGRIFSAWDLAAYAAGIAGAAVLDRGCSGKAKRRRS